MAEEMKMKEELKRNKKAEEERLAAENLKMKKALEEGIAAKQLNAFYEKQQKRQLVKIEKSVTKGRANHFSIVQRSEKTRRRRCYREK